MGWSTLQDSSSQTAALTDTSGHMIGIFLLSHQGDGSLAIPFATRWGSLCATICLFVYLPFFVSVCFLPFVPLLFISAWLYFCFSSLCPLFYMSLLSPYAPLPGLHTTFNCLRGLSLSVLMKAPIIFLTAQSGELRDV